MRLLRKRIAQLAIMTVLAASVFTGLPLPKAGAADPVPTAEIAMVNPGFEDEVGQDGKIPGWNVNYAAKDDAGGKVTHSVSSSVYHTGGKSLNLFDNSNTYTVELVSDKYSIDTGNTYTLNVWINPNEPQGRKDGSVGGTIQIRFYDANNNELSRATNNYSETSAQGKFTQISVKSSAAPAEAKYAAVALLITPYWTGNTYFDDIELKYTTPVSPTPTPSSSPTSTPTPTPTPTPDSGAVALSNAGFEDETGQDDKIPGWNANYTAKDDAAGKVSHSISSAVAKNGGKSLNLFDNSNTHTVELVSDKYPVLAGKEYTLSAWINPNEPQGRKDGSVGGTIQIRFYDANNIELSRATNNYSETSAQGKFTQISVKSGAAPAEAKYAAVALLITPYWTGNTYFDDIELKYTTPVSPTPTPTPSSTPTASPTPPLPPEDLSEKVIASDGVKETISIPVPNAGFERGLTNGEITSWTKWASSNPGIKHELAADIKYSGDASLKLTDTTTEDNAVLESDKLPVKPGIEYKASAMQYILSSPAPAGNGATFLLRFFNAENKQVGADFLQHSKTPADQWFKAEAKGVAPENAVYAKLFALVNKGSTAISYFDDFLFTYERTLPQLAIKSPGYAVKEKTFTVELGAQYAESLTGAELKLAFDASALEVVDVTVHSDFGDANNTSLTKIEQQGELNVTVSRTDYGVVTGNVGIANVTFKVLDGDGPTILALKAGSSLKLIKGGIAESKTVSVDIETSTTLTPYKYDLNYDGVVDLVDLLLIAKNIAKTPDGPTFDYDLNGDGKIDIVDLGLLAQAVIVN